MYASPATRACRMWQSSRRITNRGDRRVPPVLLLVEGYVLALFGDVVVRALVLVLERQYKVVVPTFLAFAKQVRPAVQVCDEG